MRKASILGLVSAFALAMLLAACGGQEEITTTTTKMLATTTTTVVQVTTTMAPETTTSTYAEGTWTLTFNMSLPAANKVSIFSEMWQNEISSRTKGAVRFEYFPGASLTTADRVYEGVVTGVSDLGFSSVSDIPGVVPVTRLLDMPNGYPSGYAATMAANEFYNEFRPAEFDGVHVLAFYGTGPQVLLTSEKPVRTLEDAKGLVLGGDGVATSIAGLLGAAGYAAAQNEAYDLMSQGAIGATIAPREVLLGRQQAEVVKYVTQCFSIGSTGTMYLVMNKDRWDGLPADIQQVFTDVSQQFADYWATVASALDYDAMAFFRAQPGREVIDLSAEEAARWKTAVRPMIDEKLAAIDDAANGYEAFLLDRIDYWTKHGLSGADCSEWVAKNVVAPTAP
jgi:TRAP-type C4-dicarboxylate transport system substrate-binding protein